MSGTALLAPARRLGNPPPRSVSIAFFALVAALFAGVGEAIAQVASILARADADMAALVPGLIFRSLIYLLVLVVAVRMTHGDRWARLVLTIGIGIVGLASLIVEPIRAVLSADHLGDLFHGITADSVLVALLRIIHIVAVLIAVPAMYRSDARRFFRAAPGS